MITVDGKRYPTISDARRSFGGVSDKTIRQWIHTGIIKPPPTVEWGLREVAVFPDEYIEQALDDLARYREAKARKRNRTKAE